MSKLQNKRPEIMQLISEGNATKTELLRHFAALTPSDIVGSGYPSVALLKKKHGHLRVEKIVASLLIDTGSYFEKSLNKDEAIELAIEINARHYYLSLEDIYVAMQGFKQKPIYGTLTHNKILAHIQSYTESRIALAEQQSYNHHLAQKDNRLNYHQDKATKHIKDSEAFAQFRDNYNKSIKTKQK